MSAEFRPRLAEDISDEKSDHVTHCIELRIWNPAVTDDCFAGQRLLVERQARRTLGSLSLKSKRF